MVKPVGYFIIGLFVGLTISLSIKDVKPVSRMDMYDGYRIRYNYPPEYPYGYDYYYKPLEYRSVRYYKSNTKNGGGKMRGKKHGKNVKTKDRKKK